MNGVERKLRKECDEVDIMRILKNRNFIIGNRGWVTVKRHLPIVLKPFIVGVILGLIWWQLIDGVTIGADSKESIWFVVMPFVFFLYVIFASVAVTSVFTRYTTVSSSVVRKDIDTFLAYRDEKLPILMHILIGAPSIILMGFVMFTDFGPPSIWGFLAIFAVAYMLTLVWLIAVELDDFTKGIWFHERIPTAWFQINVENHFSSQNGNRIPESASKGKVL